MPARRIATSAGLALALSMSAPSATGTAAGTGTRILFVGNSFTFAHGSPVRYYRAGTVTDLNNEGIGGVPALFKVFTVEAGLAYDVSLETHPGVALDWHLAHARDLLAARPWGAVVLQSFSTLDARKPGDPTELVADVHTLALLLRARQPAVELWLTATWPRADQVYLPQGHWYGKPLEAMTGDVRAGYAAAAAATPGIKGVIGVGDAWMRAIRSGVADADPYDGIDAGKLDLWTYDQYHASVYGYYLEALMVFGSVTGRDPRSLGPVECAGYELGLSPAQAAALQRVAFEQLAADRSMPPMAPRPDAPAAASRCPKE